MGVWGLGFGDTIPRLWRESDGKDHATCDFQWYTGLIGLVNLFSDGTMGLSSYTPNITLNPKVPLISGNS